jgi:hypothetical protein
VDRASRITTKRSTCTCLACGERLSATSRTAMYGTHPPLSTWIAAMFLIATSAEGVGALDPSAWLGLRHRTTWHLAHRVRRVMEAGPALLRGVVELDGTCVGGAPKPADAPRDDRLPQFDGPGADGGATTGGEVPKPERPAGRSRARPGRGGGRPTAFTAVERGGRARMALASSHPTPALGGMVRAWVDPSVNVATDELPAYVAFGRGQAGHVRVNHSAGEYAREDAGTGHGSGNVTSSPCWCAATSSDGPSAARPRPPTPGCPTATARAGRPGRGGCVRLVPRRN